MKGEIIAESTARFVRIFDARSGLRGEFPKRSDLLPNNAALYGVDTTKFKE